MPDRTVFERLDIFPLMDRDVDLDDDVAQAFRDIGFFESVQLLDADGRILLDVNGVKLATKKE